MRIINYGSDAARMVERFGSRGLRAQPVAQGQNLAVTVLYVAAGGEIGRHKAPTNQLFIVVRGHGMTSGGDALWQPISAGQAALWMAGEEHATRAEHDLTAVVVEAADLPSG